MTDGRQLIEDTRSIVLEVCAGLDGRKDTFSDEELAEFRAACASGGCVPTGS